MTAAALICAYLKERGEATRPQLQRELCLHEKAVETAIRKLMRMEMVADTGRLGREGSRRLSAVFKLGQVDFSQTCFSNGPVRRGRPRKEEVFARSGKVFSFDALSAIASGRFFSMEVA